MKEDATFIGFDFESLRETKWHVVALAVIVDAVFLALAMLIVLPFFRASFPVENFTAGLIQPTFLFSGMRFVLVALGVAMLLGGLRARDIGLHWKKLPGGVLVVFGLWIVMQLIGMLLGLVSSGKVALSPIWTPDRVPLIFGELIAQFLGNAFAEEVIFRGFLMTQVYLLLKKRVSGRGRLAMVSVLTSQLIFALSHVPQRIATGYPPRSLLLNLPILWVTGMLFAVLYLRTGNIFITVGVHALVNAPVTVVAMPSQLVAELLPIVLFLALIALWRPLMYWMEGVGGEATGTAHLLTGHVGGRH